MKIYSERIKQLRKERGLSQDQLAKILGVSRSTVGMYETGKREPDFESEGQGFESLRARQEKPYRKAIFGVSYSVFLFVHSS